MPTRKESITRNLHRKNRVWVTIEEGFVIISIILSYMETRSVYKIPINNWKGEVLNKIQVLNEYRETEISYTSGKYWDEESFSKIKTVYQKNLEEIKNDFKKIVWDTFLIDLKEEKTSVASY